MRKLLLTLLPFAAVAVGATFVLSSERAAPLRAVPAAHAATCGNNDVETGEECDDGDTTGGDGCSAACVIEEGCLCQGEPSACTCSCGNGVREAAEECDDADTDAGDGCSAECQIELTYSCSEDESGLSSCNAGDDDCLNGVVGTGEECERKTHTGACGFLNDSCSATCQINEGYACFTNTGFRQVICYDTSNTDYCTWAPVTNSCG